MTNRDPHYHFTGFEVHTELNRDAIFGRVSAALPELTWRRGESETQGLLTVWGRNELGAGVRFSLYDDNIDLVLLELSLDDVRPDPDGSLAWRDELRARVLDQVVPELERAVPADGEVGDTFAPPMQPVSGPGFGSGHRAGAAPEQAVRPPSPGGTRPSVNRPAHLPSRVGTSYRGGGSAVIDLYDWLPGHGEGAVTLRTVGQGVAVDVEFDVDDDEVAVLSIVFDKAVHYSSFWWPGPSGLVGEPEVPGGPAGGECLVFDQGNSELLRVVNGGRLRRRRGNLRHYSIRFDKEGRGFDVIAESVRVE